MACSRLLMLYAPMAYFPYAALNSFFVVTIMLTFLVSKNIAANQRGQITALVFRPRI
jgi:hypothetical protein